MAVLSPTVSFSFLRQDPFCTEKMLTRNILRLTTNTPSTSYLSQNTGHALFAGMRPQIPTPRSSLGPRAKEDSVFWLAATASLKHHRLQEMVLGSWHRSQLRDKRCLKTTQLHTLNMQGDIILLSATATATAESMGP